MKPRLISFPVCPYVQRARILLNTKQVEHDIDYIDLLDKPAWYLDRVPTGKVPALFIGNETLFESNVITEYLDDTAGVPLLPGDPLARATEKSWIAYSDGLLMALYRALTADGIDGYTPQKNALLDGIDRAGDFIRARMAIGYRLGAFEAAIGPLMQRIELVPDLRDAFRARFRETGRIGRWARRLVDDDAIAASVPDDFVEQFDAFFKTDQKPYLAEAAA
ncbi:MAG: glutathione S-transferase family protein [Pseudomonadota bacterium]